MYVGTSGNSGGRVGGSGGTEDGVLGVTGVAQDREDPRRVSWRRELLHPGQPVL